MPQPHWLRQVWFGTPKVESTTSRTELLFQMYRAAEHACDTALRKLQDASHDPQQLHEGYAFAVSAWEDTRTFIQQAPPDGRSMLSVCYLHTLMSILLHGHEQTPDLPRLKVRVNSSPPCFQSEMTFII